MRSVWISLLAAFFISTGFIFKACVDNQPPQHALKNPGWFSLKTDRVWHTIGRALVDEVHLKREELKKALHSEKEKFKIQTDLFEPEEGETQLESTYDKLPEVLVDQGFGAIFPSPIAKPHRFSWFQVGHLAHRLLRSLNRLQNEITLWQKKDQKEKVHKFEKLAAHWYEITKYYVALTQETRYLETWVPQLETLWLTHQAQSRGLAANGVIRAIFKNDPKLVDTLREILRPRRIMKRTFLPENLEDAEGGLISVPIATDISDRKFLAEIDGAVATHWNQSTWARQNGVSFHLRWTFVPKNKAFLSQKENLKQHLAHFPENKGVITTGGLTTYVKDRFLVLGPGTTSPRTLAHEIGHLLGFDDCYLRTLSSQGLFGLGVLEWDNPIYPDDLMCDNVVGEPRVEAW